MRLLGHILLACLILTALRWGLKVALVAMTLGLIFALYRAPVETLSLLFGLILLGAFAAYPLPGLIIFILAVLGGQLTAK
ncbi:hypothetical protein [Qipengyuania flava]|uniref:hypothetical protein n=1 Tax=Qipengyuania flava TaxID=192812 RepID=UPI00273DF3EC|nr:hypothetical protein [Qipengyuania flava]